MNAHPTLMAVKEKPCRVGVVDDEPGVRRLLGQLLESAGVPCCLYDSAESLLDENDPAELGCLIIDIGLRGISGLDLQSELRRRDVDASIIIISGVATVSDAIRAFENRADAFFEKPFKNRDLLATVERLISERQSKRIKHDAVESALVSLSPREREVAELLVAGKKTIQIAHDLGISASTVEKHRLKIFDKTGTSSVVELVHLFGTS